VEFLSENETAPKRGNKEIQERRLTKETTTTTKNIIHNNRGRRTGWRHQQ
jgi:hypothetical protein